MSELKDLLKSETKISKDSRVKYWLFCKILDYLLANQFYVGKESVSYKDIHAYLDKQSTFDYMDSIYAQTELWIHEMLWLGLINFDDKTQQMSLTVEGYKACQEQRYHSILASLYEAKYSRLIAKWALLVAIASITLTIVLTVLNLSK